MIVERLVDTMPNVRVYELAKELNISNHDLMDKLAAMGVEIKSHSCALDHAVVEKVKESYKNNGGSTEEKPAAPPVATAPKSVDPAPSDQKKQEITLPAQLSVKELAGILNISTADVQKALVKQGALIAVNQIVPTPMATIVANNVGFSVAAPAAKPPVAAKKAPHAKAPVETTDASSEKPVSTKPIQPKPKAKPKRDLVLIPRPPIVTILGHVDHGKTTLLDAIRKTNVTEQEFGGITQHIGAYQVEVKGKKITFLDTPGHAAFTAMRARGAQVTDIAILIVAADDGMMPQSIEALDHARAAGVQIIVAINKIDKADADVPRVKQQLAEHNLVIEEWGGDTISVDISAKSRLHLDELLEMILLVAELQELKADPNGPVEASVVEAKLDKGKGPIATILVKSGTLKCGDAILVGQAYGRIKAMVDDKGNKLDKAGPSTPAEIVGLSTVPLAGDTVEVVKSERVARQIAVSREQEDRSTRLDSTQRVTLADLYKQLQEGAVKEFNIVLKGDVQGSIEAVHQSLEQLSTEEVRVNLIHTGVGQIGDSDVLLASASNAVVIGFNVKVDPQAKKNAETEGVEIRTYQIIYELLDEVKAAMEGLLEPVIEETVTGHTEVRAIFRLPKGGIIAGSYVTDGKIARNAQARVLRGGTVIFTGKVGSLKHVKEDVKEMAAGFECGITLDGFTDFQIGDTVEFFTVQEIARKI